MIPYSKRFRQVSRLLPTPILVYKDVLTVKQMADSHNIFLRTYLNFEKFTLTNLDCNMNMMNKIIDTMDEYNWDYLRKSILYMHGDLLNGMMESKYFMKNIEKVTSITLNNEKVKLSLFLYINIQLDIIKTF